MIQVGSYRDATGTRLVPVLVRGDTIGQPVAVVLSCVYWPAIRSDWPVRGGEYHPGEKAAFPQAEADAMVAAGVATYA